MPFETRNLRLAATKQFAQCPRKKFVLRPDFKPAFSVSSVTALHNWLRKQPWEPAAFSCLAGVNRCWKGLLSNGILDVLLTTDEMFISGIVVENNSVGVLPSRLPRRQQAKLRELQ